jgi:hypothetical protein
MKLNLKKSKIDKEKLIKEKERIDKIEKFYQKWFLENPDRRIFNKSLNDFINVISLSKNESKQWGKISDENTNLILKLSDILKNATIVKINIPPESQKAKKNFDSFIQMEYKNKAKLMVGVRSSGAKVQYSITQIRKKPS